MGDEKGDYHRLIVLLYGIFEALTSLRVSFISDSHLGIIVKKW